MKCSPCVPLRVVIGLLLIFIDLEDDESGRQRFICLCQLLGNNAVQWNVEGLGLLSLDAERANRDVLYHSRTRFSKRS